MVRHNQFYMGALFALAGGLAFDFILIHQISGHHHLYNHPSVNIVEPIITMAV